jgi:hypothetical protein
MVFERFAVLLHVAACLLLLAAVAPVYAAPSAAERDTARSLMDEGDRMLARGKLGEAMERYRAAHAIMHVPTTGLELARVQARLGLLVEARATAMEVVNLPRSDADEPQVFQQARDAAVVLVRDLEPRVPSLRTKVTPDDRAYRVSVDGVMLPDEARDVPFRTNPGAHAVRVEAQGFEAAQRNVVLVEGQAFTLALQLSPLPAADLTVRDSAQPVAPASALYSDDVLDARGAARLRGMIGLGIGVAGLVAGSVTGLISMVQTKQELQNCQDYHCDVSRGDALRTANTFANIANVSFGVAVLGVSYGAFELLTLPAPRARASIGVSIAGLQLRGAL